MWKSAGICMATYINAEMLLSLREDFQRRERRSKAALPITSLHMIDLNTHVLHEKADIITHEHSDTHQYTYILGICVCISTYA